MFTAACVLADTDINGKSRLRHPSFIKSVNLVSLVSDLTENEKYSEYLSDTSSSATHLLKLLSNILDISKIESGKSEIDLGPVDFRALCDFYTLVINHFSKTQGHSLSLNISLDLISGSMDERHSRQLLLYLLSSAIKYTLKNNFITLSANLEFSDVRFDVEDTGNGLIE